MKLSDGRITLRPATPADEERLWEILQEPEIVRWWGHEAREDLHRSLERLQVDHLDLWQLHNLSDPIEWDTALSPGGAIDAAAEALQNGLVNPL